jgi:anti-anti-sigma factor
MEGTDTGDVFTVSTRREGAIAVVELAGELDLHESKRLGAALSQLLDEPSREGPGGPLEAIELDAGALTFIDSAGVRAVLLARTAAADVGVDFRFARVSPAIRRIVEIAGAGELLSDGA